jgi:outer membrane protein OmpU
MNNFKKIGLSALAGSLAAFSVNAAELTASGGAYFYVGTSDENGAGYYSMSDSVTFAGSGTTDGGLDISVKFELDGNAPAGAKTTAASATSPSGANVLDDRSVSVGSDTLGTFTFHGHGGSSVLSGWDDKTPNAYEEVWDGVSGADKLINGLGGNNLLRYDSPSFSGVTVHASYINAAATGGVSMYHDFGIQIQPEMVDGLTLGYAAGEVEETAGVMVDESTMFVTYATGGFTLGYQTSEADGPTTTEDDDSTSMSISYAVTDDFSIAYGTHEMDLGSATAAGTDQESSGWSASYTMGGMSISGMMNSVDNVGGTATSDLKGYELELGFAF